MILYLASLFGVRLGGTFLSKYSSASLRPFGTYGILAGCFVNSAVASLVFFFLSGCAPVFSLRIVAYAAVFALVCFLSVTLSFVIYRFFPVTLCTLFSSASALLSSLFIGWLIFDEIPTASTVGKLCLMLAATVLLFLDRRENKKTEKAGVPTDGGRAEDLLAPDAAGKKNKHNGSTILLRAVLLFGVVFLACVEMPVSHAYAHDPAVPESTASWFFLTNLFMLALLLPLALVLRPAARRESALPLRALPARSVLSVAGNALCSNVISVLQVLIMARVPLSLFSSLSGAFSILAATAVSLLFRERIGWLSRGAVALALVAVFLP